MKFPWQLRVALWYFLLTFLFFTVKNLRSKSILSFSYSNIITLLPMHDYLDRHAAPLQFADEVSAFAKERCYKIKWESYLSALTALFCPYSSFLPQANLYFALFYQKMFNLIFALSYCWHGWQNLWWRTNATCFKEGLKIKLQVVVLNKCLRRNNST